MSEPKKTTYQIPIVVMVTATEVDYADAEHVAQRLIQTVLNDAGPVTEDERGNRIELTSARYGGHVLAILPLDQAIARGWVRLYGADKRRLRDE
jgi:hypothetical protein